MKNEKKSNAINMDKKIMHIVKEMIKIGIVKDSKTELVKEDIDNNTIWFIGFSFEKCFSVFAAPVYLSADIFIDCRIKGITSGVIVFENKGHVFEPSDNLIKCIKIFLKYADSYGVEITDFFLLNADEYACVNKFFV